MSEKDKKYYESHKNECIQRVEDWKLKNPEKAKEFNKKSVHKWMRKNRNKWNKYQRDRRKRIKEQTIKEK